MTLLGYAINASRPRTTAGTMSETDPSSPDSPPIYDSATGPGFRQLTWDSHLADLVARCARDWFAEDLGHECDWTSIGLIAPDARSELALVARASGVIAGLPAAGIVAEVADPGLVLRPRVADGAVVRKGETVAMLAGSTRSVLTAERTILNLLGRLSGIATATRRLVEAVAGTSCRVYDTRKTVPGWRLLDKYAVRMGGGWNHRLGLYDAILIKDNHLAAAAAESVSPAEAVRTGREFLRKTFPPTRAALMVVEVEIDSIDQLEPVLGAGPDIVLLDNMPVEELSRCVALRDRLAPAVILEASGGIRLDTVASIAATGVDRVSTGWPTHDAPWLDVALDWRNDSAAGRSEHRRA
jgi:nicotinate-nucleotide pyrophosphorylase (carboxylating)